MGVFSDIIRQKRQDKRDAAIGAQLQAIYGAQAVPGTEVPGPVRPGEGPLMAGGSEATGLEAVPLKDRQAALATGAAMIPGFQQQSMTTMQAAIRNRQQDAMRAAEFNRTLQQDQQQFNAREEQDKNEWQRKQAILDAQYVASFEKHQLDMAAESRRVRLADLSEEQKVLAIAKAEDDLALLPAAPMAKASGINSDITSTETQLQTFNKNFAINSPLLVLGMLEFDLMIKNAKTDEDRDAIVFWQREQRYQAEWLNRLSGAAVNEAEYARAARTFIRPDMDAQLMVRLYKERLAQTMRDKEDFVTTWSTEHRTPADRFRSPAVINNPQLNFGPDPGPRPGAEVGEGQIFNVRERPGS